MNIDEYYNNLEKERKGKSFAFLAERVEKSLNAPYGIAVAKPIEKNDVVVLALAGDGGKGKHLREYNAFLKKIDDFVKSQPLFKSKRVRVCVAICGYGKYHKPRFARDLKYYESWNYKEQIEAELKNMSEVEKEEILHPMYIDDIYNLVFKPKVENSRGIASNMAKQLRTINTVSHCHGAYVALCLEEKIKVYMQESHFSREQQKKALDNMLFLNYAPDCPVIRTESQFISIESASDDMNRWQSPLKEYFQLKGSDFGVIRFPRNAGNILMCSKFDKSGIEGNPKKVARLVKIDDNFLKNRGQSEESKADDCIGEHSFLGFEVKENMSKGAIKLQIFASNILKNAIRNSLEQSEFNFKNLPNVRHLAAETKEQFFEFTKAYFEAHKQVLKYNFCNKKRLAQFIHWHQNSRVYLDD